MTEAPPTPCQQHPYSLHRFARTLIIDAGGCPDLRADLLANGIPASKVDDLDGGLRQALVGCYDVVVYVARHYSRRNVDAIRVLREHLHSAVVVLLDERNADQRAAFLEAGADDCLSMPVVPREVAVRILALLRRRWQSRCIYRSRAIHHRAEISVGQLRLDRQLGVAYGPSGSVEFTRAQTLILEKLMAAAGNAVDRATLARDALGKPDTRRRPRSVDVHICRIRSKLRALGDEIPEIRTIPRAGYALVDTDTR